MPLVTTLQRLSLAKLRLLVAALVLLWLVRLGLWLLPFGTLRAWVCRARRRNRPQGTPPDWVARAVYVAGRVVPGATCLVRAFAGYVLLRQCGHPGVLRIGVVRDGEQGFSAHAWLECQGRILIGGSPQPFVPLPPIEAGK